MGGDRAARRLDVLRRTGLLDSPAEPEFDEITQLLARLLKAPVAAVTLLDQHRQFAKSMIGTPPDQKREQPLSHSFCKHAVATRKPLIVEDARLDERVRANLAVKDMGVIAYAGVPLTIEGESIGALCAIDGRARSWTQAELGELALLGRCVERLISLRMSNQQLAQRSAHLNTVLESIGDALVACDERGKLALWNRAATEQLGIGLELPKEKWAEHYGLLMSDKVTPMPAERIPLTRALSGEKVEQELMFVRSPMQPEGRYHSVNAAPVFDADGKLVGAVSLGRDVTELHQLQERLREAAIRDELTGLHNRRGFTLLAEQAMKSAQRLAHRLALFFVDLNGMKEINDRLGHEAGDQALIDAAHVLRKTFRDMDIVARLGGDEFVALTAAVPDDIATVLGERLDANVLALARSDPSLPYRVSISVGVSYYDPSTPRSLDQLLSEADSLMYQRKRQRRMSGSHVRID